ncbi:LysR family transcriptional regulator [Dactylosporangium sp. CA-092794]|uniref:LysR family transcriptional regulator n=1 Tax=Dactylosporangium sp. CA-092794 TaxID=3239929 RepID=UPI003D9014DD
MELAHVRAFISVAQELHFGRAARRLHMSQPPLTRLVQQLEQELGTRLFERTTRRVALTAAGQAFLQPAKDVLEAARKAESAAKAAEHGEVGCVRLAYASASTQMLVSRIAKRTRETFPGIQIELYSSHYAYPALESVVNGDMDLALGRWDHIPAGVSSRLVAKDSLVIALSATHPLAGRPWVTMAELAREPFVSLPPHAGSVMVDRLRRLSLEAGFVADVVQIAPDSWTMLSLVAVGLGCSLTLSSVPENVTYPGVVFIPLAGETEPVPVRLAWRDDTTNAATATVRRVCGEVLPTLA